MKTFILCGNTQQPGVAGDWRSILQVRAKDFADAARRLRGRLRDEDDPEGRWFTPGRATHGLVARALLANKDLRGRGRRAALREERVRLEQRYAYWRIVHLPRLP